VSKESSSSLIGIVDQYKKKKQLEDKMKEMKIVGKTSLIKNFILRNNIVDQVEKLNSEANRSPKEC
jgi:hypothetical protein